MNRKNIKKRPSLDTFAVFCVIPSDLAPLPVMVSPVEPRRAKVQGSIEGQYRKQRTLGMTRFSRAPKTIFTLLVLTLLLTSCAPRGTPPRAGIGTNTILGACEGKGSPFDTDKNNPISKPFTQWIDTYHDAVDRVVNAHMNAIRGAVKEQPLKCTADTLYALLQPTGALRALAAILPPWNPEKQKSARYLESLSEADIGSVLLEHLRVYECALKAREKFLLTLEVPQDLHQQKTSDSLVNILDVSKQADKEKKQIRDELVAARAALNRTLTIIGSLDRLRPISLELECIQRASLDLRNVLGLAADTTACLPRIWDTRGSLRDLSP